MLAGYTGLTREAYALDLRQYASWCQQRHLRLFQARRRVGHAAVGQVLKAVTPRVTGRAEGGRAAAEVSRALAG